VDEEEIAEARWFTREQLLRPCPRGRCCCRPGVHRATASSSPGTAPRCPGPGDPAAVTAAGVSRAGVGGSPLPDRGEPADRLSLVHARHRNDHDDRCVQAVRVILGDRSRQASRVPCTTSCPRPRRDEFERPLPFPAAHASCIGRSTSPRRARRGTRRRPARQVGGDHAAAHRPGGGGIGGRADEDPGDQFAGRPGHRAHRRHVRGESQLVIAPSARVAASRTMPGRKAASASPGGCAGADRGGTRGPRTRRTPRSLLPGQGGAQEPQRVPGPLIRPVQLQPVPILHDHRGRGADAEHKPAGARLAHVAASWRAAPGRGCRYRRSRCRTAAPWSTAPRRPAG